MRGRHQKDALGRLLDACMTLKLAHLKRDDGGNAGITDPPRRTLNALQVVLRPTLLPCTSSGLFSPQNPTKHRLSVSVFL